MKADVKKDFDWQMRFLPTIKNIVGPLLLEPASPELDMSEATDMLVLRARDMRIGCRLRRVGYAEKYPWDFTIRSRRETTGATTELEKIVNGWGDWLFYGHEFRPTSIAVLRWFVIDLSSWRSHLMRRTVSWGTDISNNGDGTFFRAWDVRKFPKHPPICIGSSDKIPSFGDDNRAWCARELGA
jgi:hypothetical protein